MSFVAAKRHWAPLVCIYSVDFKRTFERPILWRQLLHTSFSTFRDENGPPRAAKYLSGQYPLETRFAPYVKEPFEKICVLVVNSEMAPLQKPPPAPPYGPPLSE